MSDGPDNKPTTQVSREAVLNERLDRIVDGIAAVSGQVDRLDGSVSLVINDVTIVKDRIAMIERRTEQLETAGTRRSDAVKAVDARTSAQDMEQAAQLAQERAAREALAKEVKQLTEINSKQMRALEELNATAKSIVGNKMIRQIAYGVGTLILLWLASKGITIK